ncbi:hypothetical protein KUTeg_006944 [Tegillarca granosa]|uniref:Intraflagellar transport protein 88 n=1 Tax=Tegillarca granosa TaxID=220873 RepID=A0ABQ9FBT8_TEGGR|nr:hypothetical protein KUTeg_006944 [Tegillarca granosa]
MGEIYDNEGDKSQAFQYFYDVSIERPSQVKWQLMIASCHRRSGNYQNALEVYKQIHRKFPENVECLRFLVRICSDLGLKEAQEYATKLKKAERQKKCWEQRASSGTRRGSGRGRREDSAGRVYREGSAGGKGGHRGKAARRRPAFDEAEEDQPYRTSNRNEIGEGETDANYQDPLGPQMERPKTAATRNARGDDDLFDEDVGDDLLPE